MPPGRPGQRSTGDTSRSGSSTHAELDDFGPVPNRPQVYEPGDKYYTFPITFEVELLDRFAPITGKSAAAGTGTGKGAPS